MSVAQRGQRDDLHADKTGLNHLFSPAELPVRSSHLALRPAPKRAVCLVRRPRVQPVLPGLGKERAAGPSRTVIWWTVCCSNRVDESCHDQVGCL